MHQTRRGWLSSPKRFCSVPQPSAAAALGQGSAPGLGAAWQVPAPPWASMSTPLWVRASGGGLVLSGLTRIPCPLSRNLTDHREIFVFVFLFLS